jgi:uncharacterized repeat protein (TIGR03803 family)
MTKLNAWKMTGVVFVLCAATTVAAHAQTFTTLVNFDGTNGGAPEYMSLIQGIDGNLYGTTASGGLNNGGTVFKMSPAGTLTTLYSFCAQANCSDGDVPVAGLMLGVDGNFYGTTNYGGTAVSDPCSEFGCGTVFKITPDGRLTTLYSFCSKTSCSDGAFPVAPLIQAADGNLYGTTLNGGPAGGTDCPSGCGTVFKITLGGKLTTLHRFAPQKPSGKLPYAPLAQGTDGNFYGTTNTGGASGGGGAGTVFEMTPEGVVTILHSFGSFPDDGVYPYSGLIQALDGTFYGTTYDGGLHGRGVVYGVDGFAYSFCSRPHCTDGAYPVGPVIQGTDGNFYGTTYEYSLNRFGTLFVLTGDSVLTTLYTFCTQMNCTDGSYPSGGLIQSTNGIFYGTTKSGGTDDLGTIFSLSMNLDPFVSFVRNPAPVGQLFGILGQGFKGTSSVSLNGTPATYMVKSGTLIEATVPAGATTGYVTVTTPSGVLTSNVPFHVIP